MKKILSIFNAISLIVTSTTSLVACNTAEYIPEELTKLEWQGFFWQILCRVIISVLHWC